MNPTEMKYALLCLATLGLSSYTFYLSNIILGIPLTIIGILFCIRSTSANKPKWKQGIWVAIGAVVLGYTVAALLLGSITGYCMNCG